MSVLYHLIKRQKLIFGLDFDSYHVTMVGHLSKFIMGFISIFYFILSWTKFSYKIDCSLKLQPYLIYFYWR